jgi:hypothetical protein
VIVMGTHGRLRVGRLALIRIPTANATQCEITTGTDGTHRLCRIFYCIDFSHNSEHARAYASSLAAEYGAELTSLTW